MESQTSLILILKQRIGKDEVLANVLSDLLNVSIDAAYRRVRCQTLFSISELEKICRQFEISMDAIFQVSKRNVTFNYSPLENFTSNMEEYLKGIRDSLLYVKNQGAPELIITVNNTPFFQLFNFPYLVRFKLYFWGKTHLELKEYQNVKFKHERFSEEAFALGKELLTIYNNIPTKEIFDPELMRGFAREIYFYYQAQQFEEPLYAIWLYDEMLQFIEHLREQAKIGKKFMYKTQAPNSGNDFEMYHNETLNSITSFCYTTQKGYGLFLAHNFMNSLHTTNESYVNDSKNMLNCIISNSSKISLTNEKVRNAYFAELIKLIDGYKKKINLDLE